ncbi:hypothetical protein YQE_03014, partial [Dendroctonus ponderosae]
MESSTESGILCLPQLSFPTAKSMRKTAPASIWIGSSIGSMLPLWTISQRKSYGR